MPVVVAVDRSIVFVFQNTAARDSKLKPKLLHGQRSFYTSSSSSQRESLATFNFFVFIKLIESASIREQIMKTTPQFGTLSCNEILKGFFGLRFRGCRC